MSNVCLQGVGVGVWSTGSQHVCRLVRLILEGLLKIDSSRFISEFCAEDMNCAQVERSSDAAGVAGSWVGSPMTA